MLRRHPRLPHRRHVGHAALRVRPDAAQDVIALGAHEADLELALAGGGRADALAAPELLAVDGDLQAARVARVVAAPQPARDGPEDDDDPRRHDEERPRRRAVGQRADEQAEAGGDRGEERPAGEQRRDRAAAEAATHAPAARLRPGLAPGRQMWVVLPRDRHRSPMMPGARAGYAGPRRGGRAVDCTGLENRSPFTADRGFESRPLRSSP